LVFTRDGQEGRLQHLPLCAALDHRGAFLHRAIGVQNLAPASLNLAPERAAPLGMVSTKGCAQHRFIASTSSHARR
jgi:hypothetical protein